MDNKSTTKRMIGAVVLVLVAALLLAWLLKGKTRKTDDVEVVAETTSQQEVQPISGFPGLEDTQQEQVAVVESTEDNVPPPSILADAQDSADQTDVTGAELEQQQLAAEAAEQQNSAESDSAETQQLANTDGKETFAIRPGEVRGVINPDGTISKGTGSMGTSDAVVADAATSDTTQTAADEGKQAQIADGSTTTTQQQTADASNAEQSVSKPAATVASTKSSDSDQKATSSRKPVIVAEKAVPEKTRTPSSTASSSTSHTPRIVASTESRPASTSSSTTRSGSSDKDGFVIQVLATSSRGKANGVKDSIASDGYPVFVTNARVNGKSIYRVRIGSYGAKSEAARVQARMKARYSKNEFVQNSFVTNHQ